MIILSNMDMWLLHRIISISLWTVFIALIGCAFTVCGCFIEKIAGSVKSDKKEDKENNDKGDKKYE